MRIAIIGNPIAGRGRAEARVEALSQLLRDRGHDVLLMLTQKGGDARAFAASLNGETDRIVVAGGDGTLNETVNGLADPSLIPIAPWAMGTANILARELRLPRRSPEQVVDLVERGEPRRIDMGMIDGRRFLLVASAGFDAMVVYDIARQRTGRLGLRGYAGPIMRTLRRYRVPTLRVTVDDQSPVTGALVVVSNIRNYAGFFSIADRADCASGELDICVFPHGKYEHLIRYAWAAWRKRVSKLRDVTYVTGRSIHIESDEPVPVEVDGDDHAPTPAKITVQPATVPIVVPAS